MRKLVIILIAAFNCQVILAQELNVTVNVSINSNEVNTNAKVFKTLENAIAQFMNNRKWTTDEYEEYEKIEANIFIAITDQNSSNSSDYTGTMTITSKRPVFNSTYNSTVINFVDKDIRFTYNEFDPIEYSPNTFTNNLSHVLAFYAYLIIGADYDTYSDLGGQSYLEKASDIVNIVDNSIAGVYKGWKSFDKNQRNRYWTITHMLNGRYEPYRKAQYLYHRQGLDNFYDDPILARTNMITALEEIGKVTSDNPNLTLVMMWSEAKKEEIVGAFSQAPDEEKSILLTVVKKADPANINVYEAIND